MAGDVGSGPGVGISLGCRGGRSCGLCPGNGGGFRSGSAGSGGGASGDGTGLSGCELIKSPFGVWSTGLRRGKRKLSAGLSPGPAESGRSASCRRPNMHRARTARLRRPCAIAIAPLIHGNPLQHGKNAGPCVVVPAEPQSRLACSQNALSAAQQSIIPDMTTHEPLLSPTGAPTRTIDPKAEPTLKSPEAESFYAEALRELTRPWPAVPARRHLCGQRLYRHHPRRPRISTSSARPATTRASSAISSELGHADRDRGRALARQGAQGRAFLRRDLRLVERHHAGRRRSGSRTRGRSRSSAAPVRIVGADRADLVEGLHPAPPPLRRRRRRARHPQAARPDRLAAAARLHGAALGGAADATSSTSAGSIRPSATTSRAG